MLSLVFFEDVDESSDADSSRNDRVREFGFHNDPEGSKDCDQTAPSGFLLQAFEYGFHDFKLFG